MPGPTRRQTANNRANPLSPQPPRPPNAWILYRSDKLKEIPPPAAGENRRPQAEISRMVSDMWKNESPEVRAYYEQLSEVRKAEHQAMFPGYRFKPMKREDKERLRAEIQAEKERERQERRANKKTRRSNSRAPAPLFTTDARLPSGTVPPAASGASTSGSRVPSTQTDPLSEAGPSSQPASHPMSKPFDPPASHPPSTPFDSPATSAPDPFALPLALAEPYATEGADDWPSLEEASLEAKELDISEFWDPSPPAPPADQEYLALPPLNAPPPAVLGWNPDDDLPSLFPLMHHPQPLHAVLSATADPDMFNLDNLVDPDLSELFDGTREIEVTVHQANPGGLPTFDQFGNLSFLFTDYGATPLNYTPSTTNGALEESLYFDEGTSYGVTTPQSSGLDFSGFSFDNFVQGVPPLAANAIVEGVPTATPSPGDDDFSHMVHPAPMPYMPPSGAANSSTRRVAADWRHVHAPSPEPQLPQAPASTWWS